jgi:glyoxylase-like metal-dependent hydrolase (beta-lactamase superfamily II)
MNMKKTGIGLGLALALSLPGVAIAADDAEALLRRADRAMGGTDLKTLRFSASGTGATFGQAFKPDMAWPKLGYSSFSRTLDFENSALREEFARSRTEPTGGGAVPLMGTGEQRATGFVQGGTAWNQTGPNAFGFAGVAADGRIHDLWTSPHGVIKAALRNKATLSFRTEKGRSLAAVSFTEPGRFSATALINADFLVERVESRQPHPVLGDTPLVTVYSSYRSHGAVQFPERITQTHGTVALMDFGVGNVQVNQPSGITVPDNVKTAVERATSEKAADGVWFIAGGSHNSVLIEMKDHLILVEAPLYDGRSAVVLAEAKKLVPNKPLRYVINSHHHFDHAGGLRTAAAAGATLVTSAAAKPYFDKVLANPNKISPDLLAKSGKKAKVLALNPKGKHVFSDGSRSVEVYAIADSVHAQGFNMVYLPKEKLVIEADAYTPLPPGAKPPSPPNANNVNLVDNIERNKLAVDRVLPLHGRVVPVADLYSTASRKP